MHEKRLDRNGSLELAPKALLSARQLDAAYLRELFDYDEATGVFSRKKSHRNTKLGVAGWPTEFGYVKVGVLGKRYFAHRLAWLYVHGEWPTKMIDHINGNRSDNRIANLRDVDRPTNMINRHVSTGRLGIVGAQSSGGKIQCFVKFKGKRLFLGKFATAEEAGAARTAALRQMAGADFLG